MSRVADLLSRPWAIQRQAFEYVALTIHRAELSGRLFDEEARIIATSALDVRDGVAIVPVQGVLVNRQSYVSSLLFGDQTYEGIRQQVIEAAGRDDVEAIVLAVDSPGGQAPGVAQLAETIRMARGVKPVIAAVAGVAASAGYWIASNASIVLASRDSMMGSIGVFASFVDTSGLDEKLGIQQIDIVASQSPRKLPDPATDDGRAQIQAEVDAVAQVFIEDVATGRAVSEDTVLARFGQGGVLIGQAAVDAGLADGMATLEEILAANAAGGSSAIFNATAGRGAQTKGGAMSKPIATEEITREWLSEHKPELVSAIESAAPKKVEVRIDEDALKAAAAQAVEQERARIAAIRESALPGHEALVESMIDDGTPAAEAAAKILKAERAKRKAGLQGLRDDDQGVDPSPRPTGEPDEDPAAAAAAVKSAGDYAARTRSLY